MNKLNIEFNEKDNETLKERFIEDCRHTKMDAWFSVFFMGFLVAASTFGLCYLIFSAETTLDWLFGVISILTLLLSLPLFLSDLMQLVKITEGIKRWANLSDFLAVWQNFKTIFWDSTVNLTLNLSSDAYCFQVYENYEAMRILTDEKNTMLDFFLTDTNKYDVKYADENKDVKTVSMIVEQTRYNTGVQGAVFKIENGQFVLVREYK